MEKRKKQQSKHILKRCGGEYQKNWLKALTVRASWEQLSLPGVGAGKLEIAVVFVLFLISNEAKLHNS